MQSENDVILTARRGRVAAERSVVYVRSCVSRLRWSPSLRWRAVFKVPCLRKPLGCEGRRVNAVRVVRSSSDAKERHRRPCTQEDSMGSLLAISGRPAACSLFLADQRQRYYSIMNACTRASSSFATRPRPHHVMTKYWRNLIWRCVHHPPNRQIKFPAKFSGHTVGAYFLPVEL